MSNINDSKRESYGESAGDVGENVIILEGGSGGIPTQITVANEATDATCFVLFVTAATGDLGPKTNAGLTFDSSTGIFGTKAIGISGTAGAGYITLVGQSSNPSSPAAGTLLLHSSTANGFTRMEQDNEATTNLIYGRDSVIIARNTSGASIAKGSVVYVTGSTGNVPNVSKAQANSSSTLPGISVAIDAIANNAFGQVMVIGIISGIDTSAFSAGAPVWLSTTVVGGLTATRPSGTTNFVQRVGTILVSGVGNGSILVNIAPAILNMETGTNAATWTGSAIVGTTGTFSGGVTALKSATTAVDVASATAPTTGQVLTATSSTAATWQTISGFSWGSSITGATGTGLLMTMDNSYAAGGIGQSIVLGNTQTLAQTGFKIDMGTTTVTANVAEDITILNGFGLKINSGNASNLVQQTIGIDIGGASFNTNSARSFAGINMILANNAGTGFNGGIGIDYRSSDAYSVGNSLPAQPAIYINYNTGNGGTPFAIYGGSNINTSTNGLVNFTLGNTQSGATVMQKIDLGTSAQGHTGIYILANNASTSARGIKLDLSTAGTGTALEIISIPTTTGKAFSYNSSGTSTNVQANRSTDFFTIDVGRIGGSAGTWLDAFNVFYMKRTNATDTSGRNLTSSGSVLKLENIATQIAGTLTDTVACLSLVQDNDSTGGHILFNAYTGVPLVDGTLYFDGTNFKYRAGGATKTITAV